MNKQTSEQQYANYVKEITPVHNLFFNMCKAFFTGGIICTLGQALLQFFQNIGFDKEGSGAWCSILLILSSVILTGLNIYPRIGKFAGAGALVPITGFANSVAASAIEFQTEGQVFGIGCKIFTLAGPVILYGIFTSWILGILYMILKITGIM